MRRAVQQAAGDELAGLAWLRAWAGRQGAPGRCCQGMDGEESMGAMGAPVPPHGNGACLSCLAADWPAGSSAGPCRAAAAPTWQLPCASCFALSFHSIHCGRKHWIGTVWCRPKWKLPLFSINAPTNAQNTENNPTTNNALTPLVMTGTVNRQTTARCPTRQSKLEWGQ